MKNIEQVLQENSFKIAHLLRRHHVYGTPNMETIKKAHDQHGEAFMLKLMEIIVPENSNFTELIKPKTALLSSNINTTTLATSANPANAAPAANGKFWDFWQNLLNGVGATGQALGQFKTDVTGANATTPEVIQQQAAAANQARTLYIVAGAFVALVIIILLIRK